MIQPIDTSRVLVCLMVAVVALAPVAAGAAAAAPTASLADSSTADLDADTEGALTLEVVEETDETVTVELSTDVDNVAGYSAWLYYDSDVTEILEIEGVDSEPFDFPPVQNVDNANGTAAFNNAVQSADAANAPDLATITFAAPDEGAAEIAFDNDNESHVALDDYSPVYDLTKESIVIGDENDDPAPAPAVFETTIDESASTLEADVSEDLDVQATIENIGGGKDTQTVTASVLDEELDSDTVTLDGGESTDVSFAFSADLDYDGEDAVIETADDSDTAPLSISEDGDGGNDPGDGPGNGPGDDPGDDPDDGNGGAPGGGGGGAPGDDSADTPGEVVADVTAFSDGVSMSASGVSSGDTVEGTFEGLSDDRTTISGVSLHMGADADEVGLDTELLADRPADVDELSGSAPVSYVEFTPDGFESADLESASVSFEVSEEALPEGTTDDDVLLHRYADGDWETLETTHEGDGTYVAETPGFSTFAVGSAQADVSVTGASLSSDTVDVGEDVTVDATVENTGNADGEATIGLLVDGETTDERTVSVSANDATTATLSFSPDVAGDYSLSVDDVDAGELSVSDGGTADDGTDDGGDGAATTDDSEGVLEQFGGSLSTLIGLIALVVIAVAGVAIWRQ